MHRRVARETQAFPDGHLVRREDRLAEALLEVLERTQRPHGRVGDEQGFGVRVVVLHREFHHGFRAEQTDLGRGVDSRTRHRQHLDTGGGEELDEQLRDVLRVARGHRDARDPPARAGRGRTRNWCWTRGHRRPRRASRPAASPRRDRRRSCPRCTPTRRRPASPRRGVRPRLRASRGSRGRAVRARRAGRCRRCARPADPLRASSAAEGVVVLGGVIGVDESHMGVGVLRHTLLDFPCREGDVRRRCEATCRGRHGQFHPARDRPTS